MKSFVTLILCFILFPNEASFGSEVFVTSLSLEPTVMENLNEDPITDEELSRQIKLLGSGILERKTKSIISLACVGNKIEGSQERKCDQLQHVYLKSALDNPVLIGHKFEVKSTTIKTTLRDLSKKYKKYKWNNGGMSNTIFGTGLSTGGIFMGIFGLGVNGLLPVALASLAAPALFGLLLTGGVIMVTASELNHPLLSAGDSREITFLKDSNGWNWSIDPHSVSSEKFNRYLKFAGQLDAQ